MACCMSDGAEDEIRRRFGSLHLSIDGFASVRYVGTRTIKPPTVFTELKSIVQSRLHDHSLRSARRPSLIFQTLKVISLIAVSPLFSWFSVFCGLVV